MSSAGYNSKLQAALFLSIADLFIGSAAIIVVIIVMTSSPQEPKVRQTIDHLVQCQQQASGDWLVRGLPFESDAQNGLVSKDKLLEETGFVTQAAWLNALPNDRFMLRAGVLVSPDNMGCLFQLKKLAKAHNRTLEQRGKIAVVLAIAAIPIELEK
jgi:hypothetical protein